MISKKNKSHKRKALVKQIKNGKSKYNIIQDYDGEKEEELLGILASIPGSETKLTYRILHKIAAAIFIIITLIIILGSLGELLESDNISYDEQVKNFVSIVLYIYLTVKVLKFHGLFFTGAAAYLALDLILSLPEIIKIFDANIFSSENIFVLIVLGIYILEIILLLNIKSEVFPHIGFKGYTRDQNDNIIYQ